MNSKNKILFLLKKRIDYSNKNSHIGLSTGLYNSASFMNQMLIDLGYESNMAVVNDNNDIDREVTKYRPTHVIIEALWVVPSKFYVLTQLHKNVKWIIRLHSEIPFLASEGMSLDWIGDYAAYPEVVVAVNSKRTLKDMRYYIKKKFEWPTDEINQNIIYLPNYYPKGYKIKQFDKSKDTIDISCFGAIRPLKNHILQAIAAIRFADSIGKKLNFHINSGRNEMKGEPVANNLRSLFEHLDNSGHKLINHEWTPRDQFLELCSKMDIGMQVSLSETFNIVAADLISQGVPVVGSKEIPWLNPMYAPNATSVDSIYKNLLFTHFTPKLNVLSNQFFLDIYTCRTKEIWNNYFKIN